MHSVVKGGATHTKPRDRQTSSAGVPELCDAR